MNSNKRLAAVGVAVLALLPVTGAAHAAARPAAAQPADVQSAAAILDAGMAQGLADGFPGMIALVRDGESTQTLAAGDAEVTPQVAADANAQFRIGSLTKAFVSTVLLQLEAEGKLSLDDSVEKWLPGVVDSNGYDGSKITIRELLNHTSGLPDDMTAGESLIYFLDLDPDTPHTPQSLVEDALASSAPVSAPGTAFSYSNTNYVLAGMIIQAVTGDSPATEVVNRIIKPLGLTHTTFPTTDNHLYGDYLHGYGYLPLETDVTVSNIQVIGTAGAMVSTLADLSTFEHALLSGQLLPAKQQAELETVVPAPSDGTNASYGLGLFQSPAQPCGTQTWNYVGEVAGYRTFWISNADGTKQVLIEGNEYHGQAGSNGQTDTLATLQKAFCAL